MPKRSKPTRRPLPRSLLSSLHEPLIDPEDGHGARTTHDWMILNLWAAAQKGDDDALIELLKLILQENLADLKNARGFRHAPFPRKPRAAIRSLRPAMVALGMIKTHRVSVPPESHGYATVTERMSIDLEPWFKSYALEARDRDPAIVQEVRDWIDAGAIQRPDLGDF